MRRLALTSTSICAAALLALLTTECGGGNGPQDAGTRGDAQQALDGQQDGAESVTDTHQDVAITEPPGIDAAPQPAADGGRDADVSASDATVDATSACAFKATYTFHDDGGLRVSADSSTLAPPRSHEVTRTMGGGNPMTCMRDVPCASASAVSVAAIEAAIANADVQAALAKSKGMLYGSDPRAFDGTVWVFERDDGRDFTVGSGDVPAGLRALETLLRQLSTETLAAPACAALSR